MTYPGVQQPHTFTLLSLCSFSAPLQAAFVCSSSVIAELRMCRECWVKKCPFQCCLHLPQIQKNKELSISDSGWGWSWLIPKYKTGPQLVCVSCKWEEVIGPLNYLGRFHWQLCLHVWSFNMLWWHVGMLHCLLDFISVLYWSWVQTPCGQKVLRCVWDSIQWLDSPISFPSWIMIPVMHASGMKCPLHQFQKQRIQS